MLSETNIRKPEGGHKRSSEVDDGQQWLADLRQRMRRERRITEVLLLSPSRARALLSANPDNRQINARAAETYAADIANGRWVFNGEAIIVAETGELNDGQHRCEAVVLAGKGIEILLVAGVPRSTRTTVDMGRARTTGDFLHMHKVDSANTIAAAAQMLLAFETGRVMGHSRGVAKTNTALMSADLKPTKQEILAFATENMDDLQRALNAIVSTKAGMVATYSRFIGILCVIARQTRDWPDAIAYVSEIVEGDGLRKTTPEYVVRERLIAEKARGKLGPIGFMEIVIRGWNARRSNQRISRVQLAGYLPDIVR